MEALLAFRPTPKLEDHPSSAVRECLFNLFAATLHIGGRSSTRNYTKYALLTVFPYNNKLYDVVFELTFLKVNIVTEFIL